MRYHQTGEGDGGDHVEDAGASGGGEAGGAAHSDAGGACGQHLEHSDARGRDFAEGYSAHHRFLRVSRGRRRAWQHPPPQTRSWYETTANSTPITAFLLKFLLAFRTGF